MSPGIGESRTRNLGPAVGDSSWSCELVIVVGVQDQVAAKFSYRFA